MQVTDELRVLVEAEVARAIENFNKLNKSIDGAEQKTESLGDALDSVSKKSMILSGVIGAAGIASIKFAGENEKLKVSLTNMLGSAEEASAVFEDWRRLGASPGLSADEVFTLGRAMVNAGHDASYATQTIQMLGDVAAGTGSSFGTISGSFERVRAQGKLTTRDLANLQQQGIPVIKQLAKELGTSEESVRRLAAEGKLGFSDLERAITSMTAPGGQFAGMMDELAGTTLEKFNAAVDDAKQAAASFGELMLPMATELLDSASSILRGINDMDEGTKRFVIGMGGAIAISGPAITAFRGVSAAMTAAAANPYILAIGGAIAVSAAVVGIISGVNAQLNQAAKDYDVSIKQMTKNNEDLLRSSRSFDEVRGSIRGLSRDMYEAAKETGNFAAATEAASKLLVLNQKLANVREQSARDVEGIMVRVQGMASILEEALNPDTTHWSYGYATEIEKINAALDELNLSGGVDLQRLLERTMGWAEAVAAQSSEEMLRILKSIDGKSPEARAEIERIQNEINELVSGATINPLGGGTTPDLSAAKKRWQDWYGEIAKIDPAQFGDSGAKAAEIYLAEFSRSLEAGQSVSAMLGEELDLAGMLRGQQADIQKTLTELFSINPADIDAGFTAVDSSIRPLIEDYKRLGAEAEAAEEAMKAIAGQKEAAQAIESLQKKIFDFGISEGQLAYETAIANRATAEQAEEIRQLTDELRRTEILAEYQRQIDEIGMSQNDLAAAAYAAAGATDDQITAFRELLDLRDEMQLAEEQARQLEAALDGINNSLLNLGAGAVLSGLSALGEALGEGKEAGESMEAALLAMSQEILNSLPTLFLQAGLQLIAQGQWALGLGFIAASGAAAFIGSYVNSRVQTEQDATTENAHGNVFDEYGKAARAFAAGGMFTNQIVNAPTYFRHGGGLGLMGEAGPEAIMPLTRMPNGDLGVQTAGNSTQVTVNVINNSGAEVRQEEHEDGEGGRSIDIIIGDMVNRHITSGKADRAMGARFGTRAVGV